MSETTQSTTADNAATFYYTFNTNEKGLRGNIAKIESLETSNGVKYIDMMLFVVANGSSKEEKKPSKIVNVHFPVEAEEELKQEYGVGDYVRVNFDRFDIVETVTDKVNPKTKQSYQSKRSSVVIKGSDITLLRKAPEKSDKQPAEQSTSEEKSSWRTKAA